MKKVGGCRRYPGNLNAPADALGVGMSDMGRQKVAVMVMSRPNYGRFVKIR